MYRRLLLIAIGCLALTGSNCHPDPFSETSDRDLSAPGGLGVHSMSSSSAQRYVDVNGNGVIDMPNTAAYVQGPLHVGVTARQLAQSYPTTWPYSSADAAGFDNTVGPWRWTFSARQNGSVPQGLATLPTPTSGVVGLASANDGSRDRDLHQRARSHDRPVRGRLVR